MHTSFPEPAAFYNMTGLNLWLEESEEARPAQAKTLGKNAGKFSGQKVQLKKVGPMRGRCTRPTKVEKHEANLMVRLS